MFVNWTSIVTSQTFGTPANSKTGLQFLGSISKFSSRLLIQHLQTLRLLWFLFFFLSLSSPSSVEQGCFRVLLSPKPFSFGWSLKDSDNQRWEARHPAGEGAQEAGQIYWAASGRRTIRQGRAMPHSAGRSGKDFSHCLILMLVFVCRYGGTKSWGGCSFLRGDQTLFLFPYF